ncbi:hypothetical protein [Microcoleus sp. S13_C3]
MKQQNIRVEEYSLSQKDEVPDLYWALAKQGIGQTGHWALEPITTDH